MPIFLACYLKIRKVNLENLINLALLEILVRKLEVDLHRMPQFLQQDHYLELCAEDQVRKTKKTFTAARMVTEISQIHKNLAEEETRFQKELEGYHLVDPGRSHTIAVADLVDLLHPCLILLSFLFQNSVNLKVYPCLSIGDLKYLTILRLLDLKNRCHRCMKEKNQFQLMYK